MVDTVQLLSMRKVLLRSAGLPALVASVFLLVTLGFMLLGATRSLNRIKPLQDHLAAIQRVQSQGLTMQYALTQDLRPNSWFDRRVIGELKREIRSLAVDPALLTAAARRHLTAARALLDAPDMNPRDALQGGLNLMHEALVEESRAHEALLKSVHDQAEMEFTLALAALAIIPMSAAALLFLLRRRVLHPVANLSMLMDKLSHRDFIPAEIALADPLIEPLLVNYNHMVTRLAELEANQAAHRESLEHEVRSATRELLAHNHSLAQAEKLAAVGELAVGLAHELRNPLAGIQLALANLQRELPDPDVRDRLAAVISEIKRITGLMNNLLGQARHTPEASTLIRVASVVSDLLALARYQIAPGIVLKQNIAYDLVCLLPQNRLRQALLNLVLNAARIMGSAGTVKVSAKLDGGSFLLVVEDEGPGFPETLLHEGVRSFRSGRDGGTGLGLATVRRFALDLGGELRLENQPPHGARATLILPCTPPEPEP
jgi:two-component system NtrC family sensor kinase